MIGAFDSGLGGLSVIRELRRVLPSADVRYVADRARAPYGPRPLEEVRCFAEQITRHLVESGAEMVVVACNAASAAALHHLRRIHPGLPFVGMEPAVKPAAGATRQGVVGVLTTRATFQGELFASVIDRFSAGVTVVTEVCDGWVEMVERGEVDGPGVEEAVRAHVEPVVASGADTLVLACTHYPFLAPVISRVAGEGVTVIDPAPAVARQAARVAASIGATGGEGILRLDVTGGVDRVDGLVRTLSGLDADCQPVTFPPG